jgi:hypothetical protein
MTSNVGSVWRSERTVHRRSAIVFPRQLVEPEHETKLSCIRWVVWCFVFEFAITIAVALVWGLWSA